ncbi:MAG: CDGSH iron-sulfur domain-containing protein [Gemmatimonadota bacterium]
MSSLPIKIKNNGPLFIAVEDAVHLSLTDHNGTPIELPVGKGIALCRCGASKRKPFCDASHKLIGFDGTLAPVAAAVPPAPAAAQSEPVSGGFLSA